MRFSVLASGSGGNICYIETAKSKILIDAGLSCRELIRRLESIKVRSDHLDALVITHEHSDHIKGAGPIARRFDIPVYINGPTLKRSLRTLGNISRPVSVHTGQSLTINDILIETFTKCHDAVDPMGLIISSNGVRLGLVTDLGRSTRLVENRLKECHALIIEFNHDQVMLEQGPYPLALKRRIKGPEGHLSNKQAGELLKAVSHENLSQVTLAHLSEQNNLQEKALQAAKEALAECGLDNTEILISSQGQPMSLVEIK
ncbi:MAG: MBL fold metallo-hydrolase [Deltaproteobacteria bacterium]|nr:MBL fold metallo-hydrolase [Deltaproteobacteria bacterium]